MKSVPGASSGQSHMLDFECARRGRVEAMDIAVRSGLTVGEAAAKVGLSVHTLRWYEQEGLVSPVGRDAAGRRRYRSEDLDWLQLLTCLLGNDMPVRDMGRFSDLAIRFEAMYEEMMT